MQTPPQGLPQEPGPPQEPQEPPPQEPQEPPPQEPQEPPPQEPQEPPPQEPEAIEASWDRQAADYDEEPDHGLRDPGTRAAWKELLRTWLPPRAATVADLACGTGSLAVLAAELGHQVRAVDLSAQMVARARAKTARFGAAVTVTQADVSRPPLQDGSVDVVLARHILWALPDPAAALRRWVRALRPAGRLVLVEGRWSAQPPGPMPWAGGVTAGELRATVEPFTDSVRVLPLVDPVLWGKAVPDERYLLVAAVGQR